MRAYGPERIHNIGLFGHLGNLFGHHGSFFGYLGSFFGRHGGLFGHHGSLLNGGLCVGRRVAHWEISPRI